MPTSGGSPPMTEIDPWIAGLLLAYFSGFVGATINLWEGRE